MKRFTDLNELEHLKLTAAMARLKEEAIRYAATYKSYQHSELAYAARAFSDTLDEIGLKEYYRAAPVTPATIEAAISATPPEQPFPS